MATTSGQISDLVKTSNIPIHKGRVHVPLPLFPRLRRPISLIQ